MDTAIILPPTDASLRTVAGLPVILRTALVALRCGFDRVAVASGAATPRVRALLDRDERTRSVEIASTTAPRLHGRTAFIPSDCVITVATLQRILRVHLDGRPLLFHAGGSAALAVCGPAQVEGVDLAAAVAGGTDGLWAVLRRHGATSLGLDGHVCVQVADDHDVRRAERALCTRLRAESAPTDGPLAHWLDRRISLRISRWVAAHTRLRPNHITAIGTAIGLAGAVLLGGGTYWTGVYGALLFLCCCIIDGCDGEVARLKLQESTFGQKLDVITDNIVHVAVFIGLAVGLYRSRPDEPYLFLTSVLLGGFALDTAVTYFFLVCRPDFAGRASASAPARERIRRGLLRMFKALMNRDFVYLLLALALVDRLGWFLWGTAFGTYGFAIALVLVYRWGTSSTEPSARAGGPSLPAGDTVHDTDPIDTGFTLSDAKLPSRAVRVAERGFLVAGLVLLVVLVSKLGAEAVLANLALVGWGIVLIVGQECFAILFNSLGWWAAFPSPRPAIRFTQLLAARIAGDAVNYTTPTATLGGEFVRTRLLRGQAPTTSVVASVAVAKLSQTIGQITFVVIGLAIVLDETPLPAPIRHGLLGGLAAFSLLVAGLVFVQRRGMFSPLLRFAQRLGLPARAPHLIASLRRLDDEIARFHVSANGAFALSAACFTAGWAMGVVEMYLILWFLDVPVTLHRALTVEVLSVAIDGMLFFVPAKAGTQEGGKVLIFTLLGLDPAKGLALGIVRRIRELAWALVGLTILSRHHLSTRAVLRNPVGS